MQSASFNQCAINIKYGSTGSAHAAANLDIANIDVPENGENETKNGNIKEHAERQTHCQKMLTNGATKRNSKTWHSSRC